jgi:hypothetical protein
MRALERKRTDVIGASGGLSKQAYSNAVNAMLAANRRIFDYWRTVWELSTPPLAPSSSDASVHECLERARQILELTEEELRAQRQEAARVTQQLSSQGMQVKEPSLFALSGVLDAAMAEMNFVKDSTARHLELLKKRLA